LYHDGSDEKENQPPTKKWTEGSEKPEKTERKVVREMLLRRN